MERLPSFNAKTSVELSEGNTTLIYFSLNVTAQVSQPYTNKWN
jgi:hypothetical protein